MAKMPQTGPQVIVSAGGGGTDRQGVGKQLSSGGTNVPPNARQRFDLMLRDPTIKLAIDVIMAMLLRQPWSVTASKPEFEDAADRLLLQLNRFKESILRAAFRGVLRDGWRAFEIVYDIDPEFYDNIIVGIKSLRTDKTAPLAYEDTGLFAGVLNRASSGDAFEEIDLDEYHSMIINFDDEGYGDLGEPLLYSVYGPYQKWEDCDIGARRYDQKVAGGFLLIKYPEGDSPFNSAGTSGLVGTQTRNEDIAAAIGKGFEASGWAAVPKRIDPDTGEPLPDVWEIEHISAGGGLQAEFVTREKYLDALKLRAFGIPERSATEGTFGTKAEAESHADIAMLVNLDRHARMVTSINNGPVKTLNMANHGDPDALELVIGKLDPLDRELFAAVFTSLMTDPMFGEQIASRVDLETLLQKLNVPVRPVEVPVIGLENNLLDISPGPSLLDIEEPTYGVA